MAYADLNTIHNPATSTIPPATWGDQSRDNLEFLIDPPSCNAYDSGVTSVGNATWTVLDADSERWDTDGMHSLVTNTSRITIQTTGKYEASAMAEYATGGTGLGRGIRFLVNGTTTYYAQIVHGPTGVPARVQGSRRIELTAGDHLQTQAWHDIGSTQNVELHEFTVEFLGE